MEYWIDGAEGDLAFLVLGFTGCEWIMTMANLLDVHVDECRARQQRLLAEMQKLRLDLVVVMRTEHVQWLAGTRFGWVYEPAAAIRSDGRLTLMAPNHPPKVAAADEIATYEAQWTSTLRNDQRQASTEALLKTLGNLSSVRRIGVEFSACGQHLSKQVSAEVVDIEPTLFRLRRRKHPDELARIKHAIGATGAMYARAREIIGPGIGELEMFNQLQAAAVEYCGEMLTGTGNDYACGEMGGPPRRRQAVDGELYILDLGPAYRGYFADNCRALAVNRRPTDAQHRAWEHIAAVFPLLEKTVKPGVSCRGFYQQVKEHMDAYVPGNGSFSHHLGHGIGLFPHEGPHLNPDTRWDDTFEVGDVFTAEPGLYTPELRAGIRLEQDFLVTESGVELLSDFPLDL